MTSQSPMAPAVARGVLAGLAGTAVMTAFQKFVEMPLTGRGESYAPANFAQKILPIKPNSRQQRRGVNYLAHFGIGAGWGAAYGIAAHNGLRGQRAVAAVFATVYSGDVLLNTLLGLYKPRQWSAQDTIVDVIDKLVQAEGTALIYDTAFGRPNGAIGQRR